MAIKKKKQKLQEMEPSINGQLWPYQCLASFPGYPVGKGGEPGISLVSAWYQPNNECAPIPNVRCSVTTKWRSIDE